MLNDFRPVNAKNKLSSKQVTESQSLLKEVYHEADPMTHQCIHLDNYLIIKYAPEIKPDTIITVKKPRKNKDVYEEFPEELRPAIREVKEQLGLTKTQIRSMKKDARKLESQQLKTEEKIEHLTEIADKIKKQSDEKRRYNNFIKRYRSFNECLNDSLLELDNESKEEIKIILGNIDKVILEYKEKL